MRRDLSCNEASYDVAFAAKGRVAAYDVDTIYQPASKGTTAIPDLQHSHTLLHYPRPLSTLSTLLLIHTDFVFGLRHSIQGSYFIFTLPALGAADKFSFSAARRH